MLSNIRAKIQITSWDKQALFAAALAGNGQRMKHSLVKQHGNS